jgi:hypothetical protein
MRSLPPIYSMPSTKRALLVASPFDNLKGPERDVETMTKALQRNSFNEITTCVGAEATRERILEKWDELAHRTMTGDAIVFYYSGHGALVKPDGSDIESCAQSKPFQFIVPMDYDKSNAKDFKGILDVEMSHFLWQITEKTRNVTIILDCCHSGRMARNPKLGSRSSPRFLSGIQYHDIDRIMRGFQQKFPLDGDGYPEGNPFTVRIVAGTQGETAWEHEDQDERWGGALTRALGIALEEAAGKSISWHTTMIRVRDIITASACAQHPNAEGPSKRIHFTLDESDPGVFGFHSKDRVATIEGGRVAGLCTSDVFALLPHGTESRTSWLAKVRLYGVDAFESRGDVFETRSDGGIPENGVAILIERALRPSPIRTPPDMMDLQQALETSKFLRVSTPDDTERLPSIRLEDDFVALYDEGGIEVFRSPSDQNRQITRAAEQLTRAKLFRDMRPAELEQLEHKLEVHFDVVSSGQRHSISSSGFVSEGDKACIWLHNNGTRNLYVNMFDVNVAGKISLLNFDNPGGIEIEGQKTSIYGQTRRGELEGVLFSWPKGVPVCERLGESLVIIVTDRIADLRHVESPGMVGRGEAPKSTLEHLTFQIACGGSRDIQNTQDRSILVLFDILEIPFFMRPRTSSVRTLPDPQNCEAWRTAVKGWPELKNAAAKVRYLISVGLCHQTDV